ncbi:luciferin 4-monooxygenase-like [Camponotus floridanus]|uniref:luciferin 4-monooxygenase-like n=1 Tax=Camponotus floridanus TaxID=104421 RepID=UPI000DC6833B|nr:luciferin 4-monooxygenase-like [Camponotus floridanus]
MAVEHIIPFKIENNIMIGEEELIDDSCINTGELILNAFKSRPDFIGQVDAMTGEKNTFQQMRERSVKCALWLKKIGIQRNDSIVVCTSNHLDTYIPYLAILYVGAVLHVWNINQLITVDHFKFRPKVIFADYKKASYIFTFKKYEPNIASTLIIDVYIDDRRGGRTAERKKGIQKRKKKETKKKKKLFP